MVGRYRLVEMLGEGGFGSVWLAQQTAPVTREVALKVIKQGMDTQDVITRFEAERQALAMMDHPSIAKVFDAGATGRGRPFFVMELVSGVPVTQFCKENRLNTVRRLALFRDICSAVNHAHQKGIIHRDLKPSNILVTLQGDHVVPKVIDFGIAKATEAKLTDQTFLTKLNQFVGTPAYMSPEQAALGGQDIDTRSDVYALGVLLYELLAGLPPFEPKTLLSAGYDEMRRIIMEDDPPKPSDRFSTALVERQTQITNSLNTDPQKLQRLLRRDLDWIVMKSIDKDRSRRYGTASDLAVDIGRYLANEPVDAAAPSASYKFRKFARRNRVALATASLFVAMLVTATAVSARQAIRATKAERRVTGLLDESTIRQQELKETVDLLTESTEELKSHMRRFVVGAWEWEYELDEEKGRSEMGDKKWAFFEGMLGGAMSGHTSRLEFKQDGTSVGEYTAPAIFQGMFPTEPRAASSESTWELVKQLGKQTTVKVSARGVADIKISSVLTVTVLDSDTLEMEDARVKALGLPFKPFIFRRIK